MKKEITKNLHSLICIAMALLILSGCSEQKENSLDYLAVQLSEGDSWSIIDKDGNVVVEEEYPADAIISIIHDGVYWVKSGGKYQLFSVDSPKKPVVDEEFDDAAAFFENDVTPVSIHNQPIRIINTNGKTVATLPKSIKQCFCFSKDGFARFVDKNDKWGLIDTKGKIAVKPSYEILAPINDGHFLGIDNKDSYKILILNTRGEKEGEFSAKKYALVTANIMEGKIIVKDSNSDDPNYHVLNTKGEKLFTIKKAKEIESDYMDGFLVIKDNNEKYGVVDDKGEMVIRPKYTLLHNYGNGLFAAQKDGKMGIINAKDEVIIDFEYPKTAWIRLGEHYIMHDGNEWVVINGEGKEYTTFVDCTISGETYVNYTEDTPPAEEMNQGYDPDMEDDIEDYGTYGLMSVLPEGITQYAGEMGGYPIEFTIVNHPEKGELYANFKNVNYGTTMKLIGESLPADDGAISFIGEENGTQWNFELDGDADNISGTASGSNNYKFKVKLKRKE